MALLDKYIKEPFNYVVQGDKNKVIIGILLYFISILPLNFVTTIYQLINENNININEYYYVIGGIILIILAIISAVINCIVSGYFLKVIDKTLNYGEKLPEWSDFLKLFIDGLFYLIGLFILYPLFFIIILSIGGLIFGVNYLLYGISEPLGLSLLLIFISLFLLVLFLLIVCFGIYVPLATVNYVKNGFWGLFDFKKVINLISIDYILIIIIFWIIFAIIGLLFQIPSIIVSIISVFLGHNIILYLIYDILYSLATSITSFIFGVVLYRAISKYIIDNCNELL